MQPSPAGHDSFFAIHEQRRKKQQDVSLGLPQTILRCLGEVDSDGLPLDALIIQAREGRSDIDHPRKTVLNAIHRLRAQGHTITIERGHCRLRSSKPSTRKIIDEVRDILVAAGGNGIAIPFLIDRVWSGRTIAEGDNPKAMIYWAVRGLREKGMPIAKIDNKLVITHRTVSPVKAKPVAAASAEQGLGNGEIRLIRILREYQSGDVWLTASDIADEMGCTRNRKPIPPQTIRRMIGNVVAKGFNIDRKAAEDGTRSILYRLCRKG